MNKRYFALIIASLAALAVISVFSTRAEAQQPPTAQVYCNAMAHYAEAVAKDRDNGTPEYQAIDLASRHDAPRVRSDLIFIVQLAHSTDAPPAKVAATAFAFCWEVYGESA